MASNEASLVRQLLQGLEHLWLGNGSPVSEESLLLAPYRTKSYLVRRAPDEIEAVLATIDQKALDLIQQSFHTPPLDVGQFAEAIIRTGTYDADRILSFVGGIVDLFFEVVRTQSERAEGGVARVVNWAQLMNHFIECPEIAMFEGEVTGLNAAKVQSNQPGKGPQLHRNSFVDIAKHAGAIEKVQWIPFLDMLMTVEGTESLYFWSPTVAWDQPRSVTPQLGDDFFDDRGRALFTVLAAAWDPEMTDLVALLSNRVLVVWRLRSRDKGQFQQKREFRVNAVKTEGRVGDTGQQWQVFLQCIDPKTGEAVQQPAGSQSAKPTDTAKDKEKTEQQQRKDKRDERQAAEESTQLDIWWNANLKMWVTTDKRGRLFFWDLRQAEGSLHPAPIHPWQVLTAHTRAVTSHLELNKTRFSTCSLDRAVIIWDNRNLTKPEAKIEDHPTCVLSQAYLPLFSSLVTVGCEKRVFVWSVDNTAFRGARAKLTGHQANLLQVTAGKSIFLTLDEAYTMLVWDCATLVCLQTCVCSIIAPRHVVCLPGLGKVCLAGRRLNFYEGDEQTAIFLGVPPSKEQSERARGEQEQGASFKDRAPPKWCGLAATRGTVISATEAEVRLHLRGQPEKSRVVFNTPEGDSISAIDAVESRSLAVIGTSKGSVYFLKYRSGFTMQVYPGRREEDWPKPSEHPGSASTAPATPPESIGGQDGSKAASPLPGRKSPGNTGATSNNNGSRAGTPALPPAKSVGVQPQALLEGSEEEGREAETKETKSAAAGPSSMMKWTPEDMAKGLSSHITFVLTCEAQKRVYVGTGEGSVFVFSCAPGFPVLRMLRNPEDNSAVSCLHVAHWVESDGPGSSTGLVVVGTQDGAAHFFHPGTGRLFGSVHITRALPDSEGNAGAALKYLRLFNLSADSELPLCLLTIDVQSRIRLWGLSLKAQTQRIKELKLILDGGELREGDCLPGGTAKLGDVIESKPGASARVVRSKEDLGKDEKTGAAQVLETSATSGSFVTMPTSQTLKDEGHNSAAARDGSRVPIQISAIASPLEWILKPDRALAKQPPTGPVSTSEVDVEPMSQDPAGTLPYFAYLAHQALLQQEAREEDGAPEVPPIDYGSGSETEADEAALVEHRRGVRPRSPGPPVGTNEELEPVRGDNVVFLADTAGWIWCLDIAGTLEAALERHAPVAVALDAAMAKEAAAARHHERVGKHSRPSVNQSRHSVFHLGAGGPLGGPVGTSRQEEIGVLMGRQPRPRPDAFRVVGAWPAHKTGIVSLVPSPSPSTLVSCDLAKDIKVWSTAGDLWGHFSLRGLDGRAPAVAVWPPPQVLAAQLSLMRTAKGLCRRMGFPKQSASQAQAIAERTAQFSRVNSQRKTLALESSDDLSRGSARLLRRGTSDVREGGAKKSSPMLRCTSATSSANDSASADCGIEGFEPDGSPGGSPTGSQAKSRTRLTATGEEAEVLILQDGVTEEGGVPEGQDGGELAETLREELLEGGETKSRRVFTKTQLREMIRHHGLSSGFQNFKQFSKKLAEVPVGRKKAKVETADILVQRTDFLMRPPSAFGVELISRHDKDAWDGEVRGMGARSASEGALLRYAQRSVNTLTQAVKEELGIDVRETSRQQIRKLSFLTRLDINHVSPDPTNPTSATGQAVKKMWGLEKSSSKKAGALLNAGQMALGSGRSQHGSG